MIFNVTIVSGILTNNIQVEFFTSAGSAEGVCLEKYVIILYNECFLLVFSLCSAIFLKFVSTSAPGDYTSVTMVLIFGPSQRFNLVNVPVLDDMFLELDEIFNGNLRSPSIAGVILDSAVASATILDNYIVIIGFLGNYEVQNELTLL